MKLLLVSALAALLTAPVAAQDKSQLTATNALPAEDDLAVRQVIARANQALDTGDYELYASFYTEDAVFTSGFGSTEGREAIIAAMEASRPFITNKRHVSGNYVVNGEGDTAVVSTYLIVFERETDLTYVGSALNVDTLVRTDAGWKIQRHESTLDPATERAMNALMGNQ
ncbi:nuclear transport factor 2 family protein [Sulfitobacter albidus]|uniref:Nuclear transport factor 2 family protein n=1 Tax=Sulfitobacter albidus TaxID=2829501 RepID=A0A975JB94_9RHOB|nr:nuclear transport factor 2 family protein [Sulfitobacter albidus]QUJ75256.1 nuclear transport factor 2 family protein [Sulfitobacter albidus]